MRFPLRAHGICGVAAAALAVCGCGQTTSSPGGADGGHEDAAAADSRAADARDMAEASGYDAPSANDAAPDAGGHACGRVADAGTRDAGCQVLRQAVQGPGPAAPSIAAGDLDGDGRPDVVEGSGTAVTTLLGNGDGTLRAPVTYPVEASEGVLVADFDRDGRGDVAALGGDSVSVWLSHPGGTLTAVQSLLLDAQKGPGVALASADFDGDGAPDVAAANGYQGTGSARVTVFMGHGDGTFQPGTVIDGGGVPASLATADVNGDGKSDLLVGTHDLVDSAVVYLGKGDGTFQSALSAQAGKEAVSLAVGDFDGDGKPDLVAASYSSASITLLRGHGDGTFAPSGSQASTFPLGVRPTALSVADFDLDGRLDVAVTISVGSVQLLLGKGDGTLRPTVTYASRPARSLASVDLDLDCWPDLVLSSGDLMMNTGCAP